MGEGDTPAPGVQETRRVLLTRDAGRDADGELIGAMGIAQTVRGSAVSWVGRKAACCRECGAPGGASDVPPMARPHNTQREALYG